METAYITASNACWFYQCQNSIGEMRDKTFFKAFKDLPTAKYRVEHWDAGWWQIKKCLVGAGLETERLEQIEETKKLIGKEICEEAVNLGIISAT